MEISPYKSCFLFSEGEEGWVCDHTEYSAHSMDVNCVKWNPKVIFHTPGSGGYQHPT